MPYLNTIYSQYNMKSYCNNQLQNKFIMNIFYRIL